MRVCLGHIVTPIQVIKICRIECLEATISTTSRRSLLNVCELQKLKQPIYRITTHIVKKVLTHVKTLGKPKMSSI